MSTSTVDRFLGLDPERRIALLRRLVETGRLGSIPAVVPPRTDDGPVALSPAQEDLWVFDSLYPGSAALNLCCAYHFDDPARPVEPDDLARAVALLRTRHDVLRTRITGAPGDLLATFPADQDGFALEHIDLRGSSRTLPEVLDEFRTRPFDLAGGPLMRGAFVRRDDGRGTLLLALHHVITDWWSFDVLHTEFAEAYDGVLHGTPQRTRPEIQYADVAAWHRELETAGVFEARLAFWRRYLADPPAPPEAPCPARPGAADVAVAQVGFRVDADTTAALRALARRTNTTVYGVLMAAFAVFAHRITGAEDLVLGTPTANRGARGLDRVIGYVMNAVPTRWRIGADTTFDELLRGFAAEFPRVLDHADVPVGRIVSAVTPDRVAGRSPLFRWVFMYLPRPPSVDRLERFTRPERVHTGGEHDLVGVMHEDGAELTGTLEVRTALYPTAMVRGWVDGLPGLLRALAESPRHAVHAHRLPPAPTPPHPQAPTPTTLPDLVAAHAARTPDAPAVDADDVTWTYAELDTVVDTLARALAGRGVGPGTTVGLAMHRSAALVAAVLAVQRAGAAHLPLDPEHPPRRLHDILDDARPALVLADPDVAVAFPVATVTIDAVGRIEGPPAAVMADPDPDRPAYVLFTSGSTGRPKGVVVGHTGIAGLAAGLAERLAITATSRVLQLGRPVFDIHVGELAMAFGPGATLVIAPRRPLSGPDLGAVLRGGRVSVLLVPPSLLAGVSPSDLPALRTLALGAEACPPELVAAWNAPGRRVVNVYGPTEATVAVSASDPLSGDGTDTPIGRALPGIELAVLDRHLRPVPLGVVGEVYIGGPAVAHGYLGSPGLTATRFPADPSGSPGSRLYRTGDLGRRRLDGQLDFVGRADEQLTVRGLRVEPGEIAAVVAEHPRVAHAAVVLRHDPGGPPRLVAYPVPASDTDPGHEPDAGFADGFADELRAHCAARLPAALVPVAFVALDALPLTPSGKLDRAALPAPAVRSSPGRRAPRTPREAVLCRLVGEVTGHPDVGVDDGFVEIGGDSITAIRLVAMARAEGIELTPGRVLELRTPAALAAAATTVAVTVEDPPDDGDGPLPATPIMRWWRDQPGTGDRFVLGTVTPAPAGLSADALAAAVTALRMRHPALRMRWPRDANHPVIDPAAAAPAPSSTRVDTGGLSDDAVRAHAQAELDRVRLDPATGPLLHVTHLDAGFDRPGRVLLVAHHLAVDAVSTAVLAAELTALLHGHPTSPPHGTSLRRWATELHRQAGEHGRDDRDRWHRLLTDPARRLAPGRRGTGGRVSTTVDIGPTTATPVLDALPAAFHCRPDAVLLTALAAAVVRDDPDRPGPVVLVEHHGRPEPTATLDVSTTVGWFTAPCPVAVPVGSDFWAGRAAAALKAVKEELSTLPADAARWGAQRYLDPDGARELAALAETDLRFNYLGRVGDADALLGTAPDAAPPPSGLELDVVAETRADGVHLVATWSLPSGLLTDDETARLVGSWVDALDVLAGQVDAGGHTASDFPLVSLSASQLAALEENP